MSRIAVVLAVFSSVVLFQCASTDPYRATMFEGRHDLNMGEYGKARQDFMKAVQINADARSYAYAATASYKMGDLAAAQRYIEEAARLDGRTYSYLRIVGYRALVLLAQGRQKEGLDALHEYLLAYSNTFPLMTISDVERMWRSGKVDLPRLEKLLDEQITTYENDLEQFWESATGFIAQRYTPPPTDGRP